MKINVEHKLNSTINDELVNITIESSKSNKEIDKLVNYIQTYKKEIVVKNYSELTKIPYTDILYFYCKDKETYCKTSYNEFKIKSRLYEIEKFDKDFIRVSKHCVVNFNNAKCFDFGKIGQIVIKFKNDDFVTVSRRRIKEVMEYLDERSI